MFLGVLVIWPIAALVHRAADGTTGREGVLDLLARVDAVHLVVFTVAQAAGSTVLTMVVAAPVVWLVATAGASLSRVVTVLVTVPFVIPSVVVGIAFRALAGSGGPLAGLGLDGSVWVILAAHAFLNVAVVVRVVGGAWRGLDPRAQEAARTLGASAPRAFATVVAPRLTGAAVSSAALVFLFTATSFGVVVVLGGGALQTLETAVYTQAISYFDLPAAVALSLLQIALVVVVVVVARRLSSRPATDVGGSPLTGRGGRGRRIAQVAAVVWAVVLVLGPIAVVAVRSVRPSAGGPLTLAGYRALARAVDGASPLRALGYGATSAVWATAVAMVVGLAAAVTLRYARGVVAVVANAAATVPLGVSAVTIGFGYLIVLASAPPSVAASPAVVPAVQAVVAAPVVIRILAPALASVPSRLREAAACAGAGPWRVWRTVDVPLMWRPVAVGATFAYVIALGEFGATGFVARPGTTTLPVLIGSSLSRPGAENFAVAMASSMLLIAATAIAVIAVESVRDVGSTVF